MTQINELAAQIINDLQKYSNEVADGVKNAVDISAKECKESLNRESPKKTGKYARGWTQSTRFESRLEKREVIHNKKYRLTHLLENGHVVRGGAKGNTQPFPHIKPIEERVNADFERRVVEVIENGH